MNKNLAVLLLLIATFLTLHNSNAQNQPDQKSTFWQNVNFGGNLGANFGNDFTSVIFAPQAIYQVNEFVGVGAGLTYSYTELDADRSSILDYTSNIYGGSFIGIFNPVPEVQASFDFEMLNINRNFEVRSLDDNYWLPALFLGAGYRQGNFVIGARYDILYNEDRSIYNNGLQPFVRVMF